MDLPGNPQIDISAILPSILFFLVAFLCFQKHFSLAVVLLFSFGAWLGAAIIHQSLLR